MPHALCTRPIGGPVRHGTTPDVVAVFGKADEPRPVGGALRVGIATAGTLLWELSVGGYDVPGVFAIVDRQFVRVK